MQRTVLVLVVAAVIVGAGFVSIGAAQGGAGLPASGFGQMDVAPDDVLIEASVEPDGDAVWETQYRVRLGSDDEEQAFEELRADVESDPSAYTDRFGERMRATADAAENATGREMTVTNVTVTAERRELPQTYGVLTYRFEWRNFAAVEGDRILVGDAVDALFLDDATSLIVSWEDGYRLGDVSPSPTETRDGAVVWEGPVDFTEGEPRVIIEPDGRSTGPLLLGTIGLLVAIVAVIGYRRRSSDAQASDEAEPTAAAEESETPAEDDSETAASADRATLGSGAGPGADSGETPDDEAGGSQPDSDEGADESVPPVDEDLLSNEEQVLRLIENNGGRMKQKRVAEELDWTAAKTSQVVTGLRDEGDLDGFRLGRENVLSLPEYDAGQDGDDDDDPETDENE
ncbi:DUF7345 domain-containing protein [Halorubrum sp. HHNYT27]|uniref:DUF7345 domain-containing protein n=1 Tax=Halorubrum sp. HHNYT27 TaxID=3402275 RepID=UPI003EBEB8D1